MFLLKRDGFLNHCPMKPFVICQFDMFNFVISYDVLHIIFSEKPSGTRVLDFWWENTKGEQFETTAQT